MIDLMIGLVVPLLLPQVIAPIFGPGVEVMAVKVIMRKISRGIVQRARAASTIRMSVAKIKPVTAKGPGRRGACCALSLRFLMQLPRVWP